MKKLINLSCIFICGLVILGCDKNEVLIQISFLKKNWVESYEEKTSDQIEIFRPGVLDDFPISWYRQVFNFEDNNELKYRVLAANDAHYMAKGIWTYDDETKSIKIYNIDAEKIYEYKVVDLTNGVLKLIANN